ncbi:MAG: Gfo/Idh/MocA family oxidoreductase [Tepidisphaeraceae bacterium]
MRLAFVGFRHGHVMGLYRGAVAHLGVEVVAACEEDPQAARALRESGTVQLTHERFEQVLNDVECDAIAIGDYFARRGAIAIAALEAGKHVIADKPICTRLDELERIERLASSKGRSVGCLLDLRDHAVYRTMRRLIREGAIGEVHTILFTAQHPLMLATRPAWYFEPGKHGGTINDIGVHAIDLIPWMTGRQLVEVTAARAWNARLPQHPQFQDAGQVILRLDNNGSAFGDVSYLSPDGLGYTAQQYWRVTCHGSEGVVEAAYNSTTVSLAGRDDKTVREIPLDPAAPNGCLEAFMNEIGGRIEPGALTTADVLRASRFALLAQQAADRVP